MVKFVEDNIAKRLTKCRKKLKLKPKQAAELVGIDLRTLQYHETGEHEPSDPVLKRYAELYGVSWVWLVNGMTQSPKMLKEQTGLYGITSETVIDGKTMSVTSYAPDEKEEPEGNQINVQGDLSRSVTLLAELMQSRDSSFRAAIISNLEAFTSAIEKDRRISEYEGRIRELTDENAALTKRLEEAAQVTEKLDRIEKIIKEHYHDQKWNRNVMKELYKVINGNSLIN